MSRSRLQRWVLLGASHATTLAVGVVTARDYERWVALGRGGVPNTIAGWVRISRLRLRLAYRRLKGDDTVGTEVCSSYIGEPGDGRWLSQLPRREGSRPRTAVHPVPQRQADQSGTLRARVAVLDEFDAVGAQAPDAVGYRRSFFEKHSDAITVLHLDNSPAIIHAARGEIAHVHPVDGSMHMTFSPSDAITVLEAGWGERHPLSGKSPSLSIGYLFIYSPRTIEEATVIGQLLSASVAYAIGQRLPGSEA